MNPTFPLWGPKDPHLLNFPSLPPSFRASKICSFSSESIFSLRPLLSPEPSQEVWGEGCVWPRNYIMVEIQDNTSNRHDTNWMYPSSHWIHMIMWHDLRTKWVRVRGHWSNLQSHDHDRCDLSAGCFFSISQWSAHACATAIRVWMCLTGQTNGDTSTC